MKEETNIPPLTPAPTIDEKAEFLSEEHWYDEDISGLWLDFTEPYQPPRWTLSHNGIPFANLGDIHVITGKSGHGKTSLMSILMAAVLKGSYGGLKYELHEEIPFPKILYIDTEMGKDDTIAIKNRICTLAGLDYHKPQEQFRILRLRNTVEAKKRWRQILRAIYEMRPNIVFLDGMLDIVEDYNDQTECQPIIRQCMATATEYNISIWCVLHENPTFDKMVGTLGSVLQRKVTECFAVRKIKQNTLKNNDKRVDRPEIYFQVQQLKARRYDQPDWDFEVINGANGWGVPQELDEVAMPLQTAHTPEEVQMWINNHAGNVEWPATRSEVYKEIFEPEGVTDKSEQKEIMQMCLNRNFFYEQSKEEMPEGQKNPRIKLNKNIIIGF